MSTDRDKELQEEKFTSWEENGKACEGCIFAYGNTPFDDTPDKCSCAVYQYPKIKPDSVFIEGGYCKYRREK